MHYDDSLSELTLTSHGFSQGSVLGHLLFIIDTNDLPYNVHNKNVSCFMYAVNVCLNFKTNEDSRYVYGKDTVESMVEWWKKDKWSN